MKFKLWQEDVTQAPNSGRRFRLCFILKSSVRTPFVSMDFRNIDLDSWIALITRDGFLTVLEPVDSDKLSDWQNMDSFRVCPEPVRGEETSFKVQFHHDPMDMTHILMPGWDRRSLSLVVAAMDLVRIFRTDSNRRFYQAIELAGHGGLVRDIAWAPGSIRGYDLVASGCKDGYVRVWEVHTKCSRNAAHKYLANNNDDRVPQRSSLPSARHVDSNSGITSALKPAGGNRAVDLRQNRESCFTHIAKEAAKIDTKHMDVWQVDFSKAGAYMLPLIGIHFVNRPGDCLLSTGDDGIIRFWKRSISGDWLEFAETDMGEYVGPSSIYAETNQNS